MRHKLLVTSLMVFGVLSAAVACGGGSGAAGGGSAGSSSAGGSATSGIAAAQPAPVKGATGNTSDASVVPPVPVAAPSDKLIRSAQVSLEVASGKFDDTLNQLVQLTAREGGFVSGSQASTTDDRLRSGTFTFAVPSDKFEATLTYLHDVGKVQAENLSSQDVGAQYVDLQARLKNAEAQRDAMLALLQRATAINDIIAIQNQVGQITGQIEQLKGQINYLDHATAYSTIAVTLHEAGVVVKPQSDAAALDQALATGFHAFMVSLAAILVVLVAVGPYALVLGAGVIAWTQRRRVMKVGNR